jgi:hypothetical protein
MTIEETLATVDPYVIGGGRVVGVEQRLLHRLTLSDQERLPEQLERCLDSLRSDRMTA